jgi:hypothetical protein
MTSAASRAALRLRMWAASGSDLAAEMAALLLRGELVLEMDAGGTRLDIGLHQFEGVERAAEAGFGIGDDRREPCLDREALALGDLDLVGALQGALLMRLARSGPALAG